MLQSSLPRTSSNLDGSPIDFATYGKWVSQPDQISFQLTKDLQARLDQATAAIETALEVPDVIYGVTTGFGGMANKQIGCEQVANLQSNLLSFLAAGTGPEIDARHTIGAMLLRANVLLQAKSGARPVLIRRLVEFLKSGFVPVVREYGSIGASGDLIPLATIARAVTGISRKVEVRIDDEVVDASTALAKLGLEPLQLNAKEGLALVNGTSFSSAIAANATIAAEQAFAMTMVVESMLMRASQVNIEPFDEFVHRCKPHPGQIWTASTLRDLLRHTSNRSSNGRVQDPYSLRCFPQYCGSLIEGVARINSVVHTEMNSVSDNPLIDISTGRFHQSGNFLGQYIGIAMDDLRRCVGLMAKHLDVQIANLVAPEFNGGLNASLVGNDGLNFNMGLKGLQICGNSIVPMLTYLGNPIVEHFPTYAEQFNQNVNGLSWGAANAAWKSVTMYQHYLAISSLFAIQSIDLRAKQELGHFDGRALLGDVANDYYQAVYELLESRPGEQTPFLFDDEDRWLEKDIDVLTADIQTCGRLLSAAEPVADSLEEFITSSK
ncbi:MAG: aromatic amino acid ammonia-lyase [Planctomycetota bacterium]